MANVQNPAANKVARLGTTSNAGLQDFESRVRNVAQHGVEDRGHGKVAPLTHFLGGALVGAAQGFLFPIRLAAGALQLTNPAYAKNAAQTAAHLLAHPVAAAEALVAAQVRAFRDDGFHAAGELVGNVAAGAALVKGARALKGARGADVQAARRARPGTSKRTRRTAKRSDGRISEAGTRGPADRAPRHPEGHVEKVARATTQSSTAETTWPELLDPESVRALELGHPREFAVTEPTGKLKPGPRSSPIDFGFGGRESPPLSRPARALQSGGKRVKGALDSKALERPRRALAKWKGRAADNRLVKGVSQQKHRLVEHRRQRPSQVNGLAIPRRLHEPVREQFAELVRNQKRISGDELSNLAKKIAGEARGVEPSVVERRIAFELQRHPKRLQIYERNPALVDWVSDATKAVRPFSRLHHAIETGRNGISSAVLRAVRTIAPD